MQIELSEIELLIINNSLNEVLELLSEIDYTTRIGANKQEILDLLSKVKKSINKE